MSYSPGLVDFAMGLFRNSNNRRTVKAILLVKTLLGLVEMTSGLVKLMLASAFPNGKL